MTGPNGVRLGDVATVQSGAGFPMRLQGRRTGQYPFAKVGDISRLVRSGRRDLSRADHWVDEDDLSELHARPLPAGTVVFAKIGEAIRQNFRAITTVPSLVDNNVMGVIAKGGVLDTVYLYHFLCATDLYPLASSTTVPSIRKSLIESIVVPLPRLDEQRRIVAILDQADALRTNRREALAHLDDLTRSIFLDLFGEDDSGDLQTSSLGEVAHIASGITKGRKLGDVATTQVPYLAVSNVQDQLLNLSVVKEIEATVAEIERYRLCRGDLVLTEGGDPDKLGRGTVWNEELSLCIHQNHIFRVRIADSDRLHPAYLSQYMSGRAARAYFLRSAKQTTGIASINMTQLRGLPVVVAPMHRQLQFVEGAEAVIRQVRLAEDQLRAMDSLFASSQSRAFAGEL